MFLLFPAVLERWVKQLAFPNICFNSPCLRFIPGDGRGVCLRYPNSLRLRQCLCYFPRNVACFFFSTKENWKHPLNKANKGVILMTASRPPRKCVISNFPKPSAFWWFSYTVCVALLFICVIPAATERPCRVRVRVRVNPDDQTAEAGFSW